MLQTSRQAGGPPTRQHGCRQARPRVPLTFARRVAVPATRASPSSSLPALPATPTAPTPTAPTRQAEQRPTTTATTTTATPSALAAAAPTPQEAVEILFAGYSDIADRLQAAHRRIEQLEKGGAAPLSPPMAAAGGGALAATAGGAASSYARQPWDAAMFLLFFLGFINVAGWIALWQAQAAIGAAAAPWWVSLAPGGGGALAAAGRAAAPSAPLFAVMLKRLVLFFVPLTNTAVVLTFCAAAVKAALACLRAWE